MKNIWVFAKRESVLIIAAGLAILSAFFVPPNEGYLAYIDFYVLGILFCLMIVVAGLMKSGVFEYISARLLRRFRSPKAIICILVHCVFFSSMFVTNDVALILFVPLTIGLFGMGAGSAGPMRGKLIHVIVLETLAANLGSMLTPIGNPQNLYIYSFYTMDIMDFFAIVLPIGALGYGVILCLTLLPKGSGAPPDAAGEPPVLAGKKSLILYYAALFALCILTVVRVLEYTMCVLLVLAGTLLIDRSLLKKVDYALLLTFFAFFIFVGNIGRIEAIQTLLSDVLAHRVFLTGVVSSQLISNVPAAMLIAQFTNDARDVLLGVNVGGQGTLIASLASLISFKFYAKSEGARPMRYLGIFTLYNIGVLIVLIGFWYFAYR